MTRTSTSSQYMAGSLEGLFSELVKIGEDAAKRNNRKAVIDAIKTVGVAGAGAGAGAAAYQGLLSVPKIRKFLEAKGPITKGKLRAVQLGLPTLGAVGGILGGRYRKKMHEAMSGKSPK